LEIVVASCKSQLTHLRFLRSSVFQVFASPVENLMEQQQRSTSPKFYKNAAILFFVIGCILVWQAVVHHDWVFGAFAGITFLNALMTTFKLISLRETKQ
jgi:hypothetical protein